MNKWINFLFASLILCRSGFSQGFVNLDFESSSGTSFANVAIPGWAVGGSLGYDTVSLGGPGVILEDSNASSGGGPLPLDGNYSVLVEYMSAFIGQTGTIPVGTQSLTFFANQSGLQVSFGGQNLSFSAIGTGAGYTIYGANISSYAGQTGQLLFTTPGVASALLDDIQFSTTAVPEPSEFALGALGALLLGFRRKIA